MKKQPAVPHNTPKSDDQRKTERASSKFSDSSDKQKLPKASKHLERLRKRNSPGSNLSKISEMFRLGSTSHIREVHCSCERLNNELLLFISDFIDSQEYADYLEFKRSIIRKDEEVQYDEHDLVEVVDSSVPEKKRKIDKLRALSRRALRVFFLDAQIEKYLSDMENAEILKKQEEAIATIRQKIAEVKEVFVCHQEKKLENKRRREEDLVKNFINRHNIDISRMISTKRLGEVILDVERKLRMKRRGHKNKKRSIIEKLVREYNQNRAQSVKMRMKRFCEKKKKRENDTTGILHIKGRKGSQIMISSLHVFYKEDPIIKAFEEAGVCLKEKREEFSEMQKFLDKACLTDVPYATSDKSLQESLLKNISSQIPQEETTYKMTLNEAAKQKLGTMESFVEFEDYLEARHFFCTCEKERREKEMAEIDYPDDQAIISRPNLITFRNFKPGKIYSKRITLRNKTNNPVRMRFFRCFFEDLRVKIYFEVDPDDMRIARPGLPVNFTVKFRAPEEVDFIQGHLVFLTCCKSRYYRFMLPIECFTAISDVSIEPPVVSFGTIPIWRFCKNIPDITRCVKVSCCGENPHKLIIRKMEDPLELRIEHPKHVVPEEESSTSEDGSGVKRTRSQLEMEWIIRDILKEVDCQFHFDRKFVVVDKSEEKNLKISLSGVKHPGSFFEKYEVDVYKIVGDSEEYQGVQEIVVTMEVSDYFIKCDPICVDFGICFYGTAYQSYFNISNISRSTQFLSVRIPSLLNYYISMEDCSVVIKPGESRKMAVKFLPSYDLMVEKCKYFDQETFILYFPIEVKLVDKKYSGAPPIMEHCYAIVNDCSDLTIDPSREHYGMFDEKMVLDLGECSVTETVSTKVVLRNSSYSKRFYAFLNLPRYITILPNYGFGSINAFQEIVLEIFIHPQVEDFEISPNDKEKYRQDMRTTLSVETVANLGKYRRKPSLNRLLKLIKLMLQEMKRPIDINLLEDIFDAKSDIRTKFNMCTCSSAMLVKNASSRTLEFAEEASELKKEESDASTNLNSEEAHTQSSATSTRRKKKKRLTVSRSGDLSTQQSDEEGLSMKRTSSGEFTLKKRRKSSKSKNSDHEVSFTSPAVEESQVELAERQPSLLQKKAIDTEVVEKIPITSMAQLENMAETLSKELRLTMTFVKPLYEFSFNYLEFPETPGGSYSMITTELRPLRYLEKSCARGSDQNGKKYRCTFRVAGSTQEVRVEPMYGVLEHGESIKLTLVATPKMNEEVIAAYAYEVKRNTLFQAKMEEEVRKREELLARKNRKSKSKIALNAQAKKGKSSIDAEATEEEINIEINPEEIQVNFLDLYPAELALWRSIEPYFLKTKLTCEVTYEMDEPWSHDPDVFSLETVCKVISPAFIHDQKTQYLEFGQVPIGDSKRKIITIQNLRYHDITVTTSILRPDGSFSCPNFDSVKLPSECLLMIPITYKPTHDESVLEFMEIRAESTVYQFLLSADAATPNIRLEPSSKVLRVSVKKGKLLDITFEVVNDSRQEVQVSLQKVCELEGRLIQFPTQKKSKSRSDNMLKKKAENASGIIAKKRLSFSDELTEEEIYAIDNEFSATAETPYFHITDEDLKMALPESSKRTVKIQFGSKSLDTPRSATKKDKRKSVFETNLDNDVGKTFVAKFNVLIGSSYFLRDFIILGDIK